MVSEIYLSIQGEGTRAGRPCVMVRLVGCDLRCKWCDTPHAYEGGDPMDCDRIGQQVAQLDCPLVEVTGGEPLVQPAAPALLTRLCDVGYDVLLETSGTKDIAPVDARVARIVDVKCPSSGSTDKVLWTNMDRLRPTDEVKFVVADRIDYGFACEVIARYDLIARCPVLMGPVAGQLAPTELAEWILADRLGVRLNLQLHRILWPDKDRGV